MPVTVWGFEITQFPSPPTAVNESPPPPPPESLSQTTASLVDVQSPEYKKWMQKFLCSFGSTVFDISRAGLLLQSGLLAGLNVDQVPWPTIVDKGGMPPIQDQPLIAGALWKRIYANYNQGGGPTEFSIETKTGVTTTDSETNSWGHKVGVSVTAGFGPVSATISTEFSKNQSKSHSISFSEQTTYKIGIKVPVDTYVEVWQLSMYIQAGENGPILEQAVQYFQDLAYPASALDVAATPAEIDAAVASLV